MINPLVGPRPQRFQFHKQLLNGKSISFRGVFVAHPDCVSFDLPNIDPVTFLKVHQWLYPGNTKSVAEEIALGFLNYGRIGAGER
jgi:hypothetical protein